MPVAIDCPPFLGLTYNTCLLSACADDVFLSVIAPIFFFGAADLLY